MPKRLFYGDDARNRVLAGAEAMYNAVANSYGPLSGNAVIDRGEYYDPIITHDGVTIAKNIELDDTADADLGQRVGFRAMRKGSEELNLLAADGTTTVLVLAYHILKEAVHYINSGSNMQAVRRGIEAASKEVLADLKGMALPIKIDSKQVLDIAVTSASGDKEIAEVITEVVRLIGADGAITIESSKGQNIDKEIVEGFSIEYGFNNPEFINDTVKQHVKLEQAGVILLEGELEDAALLPPLINQMLGADIRSVVIIADEVSRAVQNELIKTMVNDIIQPVVVKAPGFGEVRKELMQDIATFTGAKVISVYELPEAPLEVVGRVGKAVVKEDKTTFFKGAGKPEDVAARIELINKREKSTELEREQAKRRMAALAGKVAIIKVGGVGDEEIAERKDRVDDVVGAVQGAVRDGIVPGGGVTLVALSKKVDESGSDGEAAGRKALKKALKQPFVKLMDNAGLNSQALLAKVEESAVGRGVNIKHHTPVLVDMMSVGVIDPVHVTTEVIRQAVSIAVMLATTDTLAVEIPEKSIANNA